jgi:hypothetical protein
MAAFLWALGLQLPAAWPPGATLGLQVAAGAFVYLSLVAALRLRAYREWRDLLAERRRPRGASALPVRTTLLNREQDDAPA